jgi:hypothetical protein
MTDSRPRIELFLRSLAPTDARDQQEQVLDSLQTLEADDQIKGFEVVLCGDCVCPSSATAETEVGERLLRRYRTFEEWADDHDRDLTGFDQQNISSLLTGTTVTGIVFPRIAIAEYRDGDLAFVAPSSNGVERTSVTDRLADYTDRRNGR